MGELNGALTRVRQMLCSPSAVNAARAGAKQARGSSAVLASTVRLPQRTILERLVAQAAHDYDTAAVQHLRVRAALHVARVALKANAGGAATGAASEPGATPGWGDADAQAAEAAPAMAGNRPKGRKRKASVGASAGGSGSRDTAAAHLHSEAAMTEEHSEIAVMEELEALIARSKARCASASDDEVVQRLLEVRWQCSKCNRVPGESKSGAPRSGESTSGEPASSEPTSGEPASSEPATNGPGGAQPATSAEGLPRTSGAEDSHMLAALDGAGNATSDGDLGACSKGGAHTFRIVAGRRWSALRASLRKLYLGRDAPWDAEDEREAKAAAAAEARTQDAEGHAVHSRRQSQKDAQKAAAAAALASAVRGIPPGWERPARRHPALLVVLRVFASGGEHAALEEGERCVATAAAALREKRSNLNFLQAKLDRFDASAGVGGGAPAPDKDGGDADAASGPGSEPPSGEAEAVMALEAETCPICFDDRTDACTWVVTPCGHAGCYECILGWVDERHSCPVCKQPDITADRLFEVEPDEPPARSRGGATNAVDASLCAHAAATEGVASSSVASGSLLPPPPPASAPLAAIEPSDLDGALVREYGTKMAALVLLARRHVANGEKLVVFSAWSRLLQLAASALDARDVACASLVGSAASKLSELCRFGAVAPAEGMISALQAGPCAHTSAGGSKPAPCDVLLVPLFGGAAGAGGSGAAGLNLQVASVAILLEPQLSPGIEQQAVGRISRIGQQRATTCIHLVIRDSIEESILQWQQLRQAQGAAPRSGNAPLTASDFAHVLDSRRAAVATRPYGHARMQD